MGKARRHYLQSNLLQPFLGSRHYTCHHLTQPAGLASLNRSTGSMSLYNHATGNAVNGWFNCKQGRRALPI